MGGEGRLANIPLSPGVKKCVFALHRGPVVNGTCEACGTFSTEWF